MVRLSERTGRARLILVVLLAASLALVTIDFRSHGHGPLERMGHAVSTVLGPLQDGLSRVFRPVGNFLAGFTEVGSLKARLRRLEIENGLLRQREEQVTDISRENDRLRQLLGMRDRLGISVVTAEVVGAGPSNFEHSIVIDLGSADGLRKDMAVIGPSGLVGRVIATTSHTSRVVLLLDPSSSVAGRVASSGEAGLLTGSGRSELLFQLFDPKAEVSAGDQVVSSGYQGGVYPPGVPIGTITSLDPAAGRLTRIAHVQPSVDFTSLDFVLVVTGGGR